MQLRQASDSRFQVDELDGLRGLAVLLVICSHTSNIQWYFLPWLDLRGVGKAGVYLFFILSAYLLSLPLLYKGRDILSRRALFHYGLRRFLRIYPVFFLYLALTACSTWFMHHVFGPESKGIPFSLNSEQFVAHLLLQDCLGVTWSIAAEFKFYFILPFLAFAFYWASQRHFLLAVTFGLLLIAIQKLLAMHWQYFNYYQSFWPYLPIFIAGLLLAMLQKHIYASTENKRPNPAMAKALALMGLAGIALMTPVVISALGKPVEKEFFHEYYFWSACAWAGVLFGALNSQGILNKLLRTKPLRFLGAISFSLYLLHPIPIFILQLMNIQTPFNAWIVLLSSSAAAYLSARFIEYPLSRIRWKPTAIQ